ncbi:DUF2306 domain-containing protein [Reichenbachiella ulvae]|uniref:DUF2306 domain-containing protein n=1 Tax=Reichenbachiella ulvae TaxID=2980104 RepID=A0ABT3CQV0_9BACT|nr:DUF2306 domain-containing protein [Reichenbachiella ulvae]MCV9385845.1 DUF2306 domain-containing protein [Reichenbachiella ulvae]
MRFKINIALLSFFSFLMLRITLPYLAFDDHTAFLRIKQWVIDNSLWKTAFYIHVLSSMFCLIAGFTQFSNKILTRYPVWHRTMGQLYVGVILFLSGPSGLIMSIYANGGFISQLAFTSLSLLWLYFTFQGYYQIRKGNLSLHQQFIIRSYALTLSALTLRAWKWVIVLLLRPHPMDVYQWVAWLGWVPNLLIAEWYIRNSMKKSIALK